MVGQSIAGVLAEVAGLEVVGICRTTAEACALIRRAPPQLLVLDVELNGDDYRDPAALLRELNPSGALLFVTALAPEFAPPADLAPITIGVVDKADAWDALLTVVQTWLRGRSDRLSGCDDKLNAIDRLSPRERRLMLELGNGQLNKQIAAKTGLSTATVESYRKGVAAKLGVSGAELVRLAVLYRCLRWTPSPPES